MNLNKFFTLLMGKCWHKWELYPKNAHRTYQCITCGHSTLVPDEPDHLSNPLPVLEWMQENMPREFEAYCRPQRVDRPSVYPSTDYVFRILDLSNLAQWLIDHPEWGYTDEDEKEEE